MPGKDKKYAVEGMRVKCSMGTTMCTLNTMGHGVTHQGKAVLNANDHIPMVNIMTFGTCINKPCVPVTPLAWRFCNEEHMIDGAPALTTDSLCNCALGGVISIVDNSVSMGGIGAQSVKSKSDVGNKPEIEETTHPASMHDVHTSEEINSDLKINTEIVDNDGKASDIIIQKSESELTEEIEESIGKVRIEGNKNVFTNNKGMQIIWTNQTSKDIDVIIDSKLKSRDLGDVLEGEVAMAVKEVTEVKGVGVKLLDTTKSPVGDLDILTDNYIIEVKKSLGAVKEKQIPKYTDTFCPNYVNAYNKKVIYFIQDATPKVPKEAQKLQLIKDSNIIIVDNVDKLKEILRNG